MTSDRRWTWVADLVAAAVVVLLCLYAHDQLIAPPLPVHADEAGHVIPAGRMAVALGHGDWAGFWQATWLEVAWPFFHPWYIATMFLAFGVSTQVARVASLVAFGATLCLLPAFAREVGGDDVPVADDGARLPPLATVGWMTLASLLTASLWGFACAVMSESLGMLMTLLTVWVEARTSRRSRLPLYLACGVLAAFTFFTKYSYGVPLVAALVLAQVLRVRSRGWRPLLAVSVGVGVPVMAWLAFILNPELQRYRDILNVVVNRDEGLRGLASLFYYPLSLLHELGWVIGVLMLLGLLGLVLRRRVESGLCGLLLCLLTLTMLTLHPNKQWRYFLPALPVLPLIAEAELARRLPRWRGMALLWAAVAVALFVSRGPLVQIQESARDRSQMAGAQPLLAYVVAQVPHGQPVLVLGSTGLLPHSALIWDLFASEGREPDVELLLFPGEDGWDPRYRSGYPAEMRPEYATLLEAQLAKAHYTVVTFEIGLRSPFLPDWMTRWDAWGQNYVRAMKARPGYTVTAERAFADSDTVVRIYTRAEP